MRELLLHVGIDMLALTSPHLEQTSVWVSMVRSKVEMQRNKKNERQATTYVENLKSELSEYNLMGPEEASLGYNGFRGNVTNRRADMTCDEQTEHPK